MIIDKKLEKMYFECLLRKKAVDQKLAAARALLLIPPVILLAAVLVIIFMNIFSDAFILAAGAVWYGYSSKGADIALFFDLIVFTGFIFMALNLTIYKTEFFLKKFPFIYGSAIGAFIIFLFIFGYNPIYVILGIVSLVTALFNRSFINEDTKLSKLDGYPHFNPTLMKDVTTPFAPATTEELDSMTAEERIMYEREH